MGSTGRFRCPLCGRVSDGGYALHWVRYPTCSVCNFRQTSDPSVSAYYSSIPNGHPVTARVATLMSPSGGLTYDDTVSGLRQRQLRTIVNDDSCRLGYILESVSLLELIASFISSGKGDYVTEPLEINFLEEHGPSSSTQ